MGRIRNTELIDLEELIRVGKSREEKRLTNNARATRAYRHKRELLQLAGRGIIGKLAATTRRRRRRFATLPIYPVSGQVAKLLALRNASTVLKALKKSGLPENDNGLTGPMVMNEYWRLFASKAECGSRKS